MRNWLLKSFLVATVVSLILVGSLTGAFSEVLDNDTEEVSTNNFEATYTFDLYYGRFRSMHTLHVSLPETLFSYYDRKGHFLSGVGDYAKFATPEAFEIVAQNIRSVTNQAPNSDEQFANAVLRLVRQIPYVKSSVKYPVEAMVENSGDCDVLSLLAASIMKAGGLDVVLLHYKNLNPSHMNIGVYLPYKPIYRSWWTAPTSFEYKNKTYWMAECTSRGDWKVGDRPELLANVKPSFISLEGAEKSSPGRISSSLDNQLIPSSIDLTVSSDNSIVQSQERFLTFTGEISPIIENEIVTVYIGREGLPLETYESTTDKLGGYSFSWNFTQAGKYSIVTSWSGNSVYAGSDSQKLTVFAGTYEPIYDDYFSEAGGARASAAPFFGFYSQSPKNVLASNVSGAGVLLSGEFMVLSGNDTETAMVELTIPKVERVMYFPRTRGMIRVVISEEQIITQPVDNNQLGFILRQDGEEEYSASVSVLENKQLSQISSLLQESKASYINASDVAENNRWYKIEATLSRNWTSAKIFEMNNTLLKNIAAPESPDSTQMGILMGYPPNSILAFRNLKVSTLDAAVQTSTPKQEQYQRGEFSWLGVGVAVSAFLAIGLVAFGYAKRQRKNIQTK